MSFWDWLTGRDSDYEAKREKEIFEQKLKQQEEERKKQEEAKRQEEDKKPKEMMDVYVEGEYSFKVFETDVYWCNRETFAIEFKYIASVKFLDEEITSKGSFYRGYNYIGVSGYYYDEESAYILLAEMLKSKEGQEEIMSEIKYRISRDIDEHSRQKNIEKIKKEIEESANRQFQFTFEVEKK